MVGTFVAMLALQELSASKISVQLLADRYSPGAKQIVAAGPRVLKIFDLGPGMREALADYKTRFPQGTVVLRVWTTRKWTLQDDPEQAGRAWWTDVVKPHLDKITAQERRWIDYVEGPNEGDSTPTWRTVEEARWFSRFTVAMCKAYAEAGVRPNIGSIAVGNPGGNPSEFRANVRAFIPALEAAKKANGSWGYHAYTLHYTTDPDTERWFSLRYRMIREEVCKVRPDLSNLPLILTEGGVDLSGNIYESGWVTRGSADDFMKWLRWFDTQMRLDPYVIGLTLFQSGGFDQWPSFEVEAAAPRIAEHLRETR